MPALIIGANLPDIDATCTLYGIESLAMRRGVTHGPIAWIVLPLVLAALLWAFDRWQNGRGTRPEKRAEVRFLWLWLLALIGCLTHPALDWLNSYGIRLLEPFSSRWFYGDALFIIDVWLWLGLGFSLWLSLRRERVGQPNWRRPARWMLVVGSAYILANIGLSAVVQGQTLLREPYPRVAVANPVPFAPWRRDILLGYANDWQRQSWSLFTGRGPITPVARHYCRWPDLASVTPIRPDLAAFLFWSRLPFAVREGDGIAVSDARFARPLLRGQFSVHVPGMKC